MVTKTTLSSATLFDYSRSSAAYRVRIACNLKNIDVNLENIDLLLDQQRLPSYADVNPARLVPTLAVKGGFSLSQSISIIWYLDHMSPAPRLFSADAESCARQMEMALMIACDIHPLNNLRVLKFLKNDMDVEEEKLDKWYAHWVAEGFKALEVMVQRHGSESFCVGDTLSVVDVCLVPQMFNARRFNVSLKECPALIAIDETLRGMDAFARASPDDIGDN